MPKPILNNNLDNKNLLNPKDILEEKMTFKSPELAFRKQRPANYVEILKNLDVGGQLISPDKMKEIVETIKSACPEIILEDTFLGVLGKCYLGDSYDVHTLSINEIFGIDEATHLPGYGRLILKHYTKGETLPSELEKGRSLARNPNYAFVEIYKTKIIALTHDGTTAIINT